MLIIHCEVSVIKEKRRFEEKKPGKKPFPKGIRIFITGIMVGIVFWVVSIWVKYNLSGIIEDVWNEIWRVTMQGIMTPM
jgi:hypothetical protein